MCKPNIWLILGKGIENQYLKQFNKKEDNKISLL